VGIDCRQHAKLESEVLVCLEKNYGRIAHSPICQRWDQASSFLSKNFQGQNWTWRSRW